jgi:hypothetical protein
VEEKLELLEKVDKKIDVLISRKQNFKNEKYSKTNMAEQKTDSGGDN